MAASDEARQLLAAARKDWRALGGMDDPEVFADEIFGFHAQQAAEKALKAWPSLLGAEYPKSNDLSLLIRLLRDQGQSVEFLDDLVEFNPYAVQFRYDALEELGSPLDRNSVHSRVDELLRMIEAMM